MGAAVVCDAELDWPMDVADSAGNGRVRKPGIGAVKTLQNPSQALDNTQAQFVISVVEPL